MRVTIDVDNEDLRTHNDPRRAQAIRAAAYFLLHAIGDMDEETTEAPKDNASASNAAPTVAVNVGALAAVTTSTTPPAPPTPPASATEFVPPPPPLVPADSIYYDAAEDQANVAAIVPSNVVNFPVPPPPSPSVSIAAHGPQTSPPAAPPVAGVGNVVSVEVDASGLPWDARIHQKSKNKMKNQCWKVIKGLDPTILAAVTAELAARKGASAPVTLPQEQGSMPLPPQSNGAAATNVPTPPVAPSVPVPPPPATGAVLPPVTPFRELIDKISAATKDHKITPQDVSRICQHHGAPNLMQLNGMQHLVPKVTESVDAVLAGLSVDAVLAGLV